MYDEEEMNPALRELEAALRRTQPAKTGLNRDHLMFNAGRASARSSRPWQALSGVLMALLLGALFVRPDPSGTSPPSLGRETMAVNPRSLEAEAEAEGLATVTDQVTYLRLRRQVIRGGLGALPSNTAGSTESAHPLNREKWLANTL